MKFDILKTRKGKLKDKIVNELGKNIVNIDNILKHIDDYEKDNLDTIDKLKKDKIITLKRINGSLKSCINAHGPITKQLLGSASKRVYGSLLENHKQEKSVFNHIEWIRMFFEITLIIWLIKLLLG